MNFNKWFEEQFGKDPDGSINLSVLWDKADAMRREL